MRLLPGWPDHVSGGPVAANAGADRRRYRCGDGWQPVPVRHVPAHSQSHPVGCRREPPGRRVMNTMAQPGGASDADVREILRAAEMEMSRGTRLDRRSFIKLVGLAGGGFALAFSVGKPSVALADAARSAHAF